jgi:hypothetical protein
MPYIKQEDKKRFDSHIEDMVDALSDHGFATPTPGDVNYVISKIIWELFNKNRSYTIGNNLIGVLECVKQEFYRRQLAPYEDEKIKSNGDIV